MSSRLRPAWTRDAFIKVPTDCIKLSRSFGAPLYYYRPFRGVQFALCNFSAGRVATWIASFLLLLGAARPAAPAPFRGSAAFTETKHAVSFGQRPSGSANLSKLRDWIASQLKLTGGELSTDSFEGRTPSGPTPITNLIVKFAGTSGK